LPGVPGGDAAHAVPPMGAFGMNTGIADAHNLAWKIALVLRGVAGPASLDTYDTERGLDPTFDRLVDQRARTLTK
jgi:2-polyprenyl-6-methoxyphenol hydroxylase-like FAD-dependent oxidoreductase